ncbi:ph domain containing protein [Stylonychia lemnae]|uniref:Ph domain containing protein n=1 Tax=Stylonychia lemnae TaxID=5949 RepID=A0A078AJR8_STYLE|nr:ph domain containing protein [Stylonychia lemnae]|eukprot:CDW82625.1 ph domain containing protein [Stylonychia lemnae]
MFEGILEKFLQQKLGKYIEGIDKQNLSFGVRQLDLIIQIWNGNILLENLKIKPNVFENHGLPLRLKFGKIKKLSIKVPWTRLTSSPVELTLETLYLVVVPKHQDEWEIIDNWSFQYKKKLLDEFTQIMAANLKLALQSKKDQKEDGYVDRLVTKIVDNLQLRIQNIHIRYEDSVSMPGRFHSQGFTLKELSINTTNGNWDSTFYDRMMKENKDKPIYKRLKIDGLAIYLQVDDEIQLSNFDQQNEELKIQDSNRGESDEDSRIEKMMESMFSNGDEQIADISYFIQPIKLEIRLTQITKIDMEKPMFDVEVILSEFSLTIQKKQYEVIFKFIDFIQQYQKFRQQGPIFPIFYEETKGWDMLRRSFSQQIAQKMNKKKNIQSKNAEITQTVEEAEIDVDDDDEFFDALEEQVSKEQDIKEDQLEIQESFKDVEAQFQNNNAVEWWKYAIGSVLKDIRFKKGSWTEFKLTSWRRKQYSRLLIQLVRKCLNDDYIIQYEKLKEEERFLYNHIIQANDLQDLQNWIGVVIKKKIEKEQLQKEQESKDGILSYFLSWGGVMTAHKEEQKTEEVDEEEFVLNDEEIDSIRQSIKNSLAELPSFDINDLNLTEEQKKNIIKFKLQCQFKSGKINLIDENGQKDKTIEFVLFQQDMIADFLLRRNETFELMIRNRDAGLLFIERNLEKEIISKKHIVGKLNHNKMQQNEDHQESVDENQEIQQSEGQSEECLWEIIIYNQSEKLDSPIKLVYDAAGISAIADFFKEDYTEEIRAQALDKLSSIKDQTSVSVQDLLYKKSNNFKIKIASPIIEIPFKAHNSEFVGEPEQYRDRTWLVNLGNIQFENSNENEDKVDQYERFYLRIDQMGLQYIKQGHCAEVLEEVTLKLDVGVKNKLKAAILQLDSENQNSLVYPEVIINANLPDLNLNMSPDIYNGLVNLNEVLKSKGAEEDLLQLKNTKDQLIKDSYFQSDLLARGIQGSYLYFYKEKRELMPLYYIFLSECEIVSRISEPEIQTLNVDSKELKFMLLVTQKSGQKIYLKFQDNQQKDDFKQKFILKQQEMMQGQYQVKGREAISEIIHKNPNEIGLILNFAVGNIQLKIWNQTDFIPQKNREANNKFWLLAKISNMNLQITKYVYEVKLKFDLSSIMIEEAQDLKKVLLKNEEGKNLCEILIDVYDIYSPNIEDCEIKVVANLGKLYLLFEPITINETLKFFRNVKSSRKQDIESLKHKLMHQDGDQNDMLIQKKVDVQTCKSINLILIKAIINASGISIVNCHHKYRTPLFEMNIGDSKFSYEMHYDHDIIEGTFTDFIVYDLTSYPKTIDPRNAEQADLNKISKLEKREIIGCRDKDGIKSNQVYFKTILYTETCPLRIPLMTSQLILDISAIKILYIYELAFRLQDYFFDKFLWAVTDTDPYVCMIENQSDAAISNIGSQDKQTIMNFDLKQSKNEMVMDIKIHRPYVILKDRPYSNQKIEVDLGEMTITCEELVEGKRFYNCPEKEVLLTNYIIEALDLGIKYIDDNQEFQLTEDFELKVDFSNLNHSPYLKDIDTHDFDKSYNVLIQFKPLLQLKLTQEIYTFILKLIDLNFSYTDYLDEFYYFKNEEEYFKTKDELKKAQTTFITCYTQISFYEKDQLITQLGFKEPNFVIDVFLNRRYNYEITFEQICCFYTQGDLKQLLFGKLRQLHRIPQDQDPLDVLAMYQEEENDGEQQPQQTNQLKIKISMYPNGAKDFVVQAGQIKVFVHPYFYLILYNFFTEGMPTYDINSFDKPNEYNSNIEDLPEMKLEFKLKDTLVCFAPEQQQQEKQYKTIACQSYLEYEFKREKIRRIKNQMWELYKESDSQDLLGKKPVQLPISWMRLQGISVCPFICELDDLETYEFNDISKRQIISPFNISYFYARYLQFRPAENKIINYEKSEIKMDMIMLKISYYDAKLLYELSQEFSASFIKFNDYYSEWLKKKTQQEMIANQLFMFDQDQQILKRNESNVYKSTQKALEMLTSLGGRKNTFKPMRKDQLIEEEFKNESLAFNPRKTFQEHYDQENRIDSLEIDYDKIEQRLKRIQSSGIQIVVINDYNNTFYPVISANIYNFLYKMQEEYDKKVGDTQIKGMVSYYNSIAGEWEPLIEKVKIQYLSESQDQQTKILLQCRNDLNLNFTEQLMQTLISTYKQLDDKEQEESSQMQNLIKDNRTTFNNSVVSSSTMKKQGKINNESNKNEYKVTPYTIVNYSAKSIVVKRVFSSDLNKRKKSNIPKEYSLMPGEQVDYEVDYEEEAKQLMRISRDELVRKHDYINVIFNQGIPSSDIKDDYIGFGVKFENMRKVFMLRSPYVVNNMTDQDYQLKILEEDGKTIIKIVEFKPMQCYPIGYEDMNQRFSISSALAPNQWSNSIKFKTIIDKVPKNTTTYLYHGKQFSVITKEKSEFKKCYNINIKTPVIIKNALPCNLRVRSKLIIGERLRLSKQPQEEQEYEYEVREFFIPKGQTLQLYNYNLKNMVNFMFNLDNEQGLTQQENQAIQNQFSWLDVAIKNTEFRNEKTFIVKDANNKDSQLEVCAKMSSTRQAGVQITLYVKNVIINNTDQKLLIYYDKKTPAAGQQSASDNSVVLLSSVKNIILMLIQKQKVMACIDTGVNAKIFSDHFIIDVAAVTNTIQIKKSKFSVFEFKVKTQLSLACTQQSEIYLFQDESVEDLQIILSGQRMPFFYSDVRRAHLISFKCVERENAEYDDLSHDWTFKFSLNEVGRIAIINRSTKSLNQSKFILVEKDLQEANQIMFVTFSEENQKFPTYKLENKSKLVKLQYYQKDHPHNSDVLLPGRSSIFSWTNPQADQQITLKLYKERHEIDPKNEFQKIDIQPDNLELNLKINLPQDMKKEGQRFLFVYAITNGYSKIVTVSDISLDEVLKRKSEAEKSEIDTIPKQVIDIQLTSIGISLLVKTYQQIRKEFAFVYLEGIKFIVIETEDKRELQLKINYSQIDNNIGSKQIFPIIMYPKDLVKKRDQIKKAQKEKKSTSNETVKDFFNSAIFMRKDVPNVIFFEQIDFLMQTMVLQMDDELIGYIYRFLSQITDSLNTNITGIHEVFRSGNIGNGEDWLNYDESIVNQLNLRMNDEGQLYQIQESNYEDSDDEERKNESMKHSQALKEDFFDTAFRSQTEVQTSQNKQKYQLQQTMQLGSTNKLDPKKPNTPRDLSIRKSNAFSQQHSQSWLNYNIENKGKKLYIREYKSSPIEIELSFLSRVKMDIDQAEKQFSLIDKFRTFGLTLANVDNAPIRINSLKSQNIFGTPHEIAHLLNNHYSERLKKNLFSLVGSSNILGNPTNFIQHMGTGVQDFFYKPIEGMVQGPLEGGKGLIDGTSSLIKNTVQGTFGSASKMISSVSKGLLFITDDMDFINKREEDNMDKPKNVLEGVGYGLKSTFTGIASGITGVIENPYSGAKKDGVTGFLKGTYKGVSGLVVKPISGALDFFSKTSEGIKNTASSNDKQVTKIRSMRPFYGKQQLIKVYDEFHAYVVQHLMKISRGAYSKDHFIDALHYANPTVNWTIVLTEEHLLLVNSVTREVINSFDSMNLNNVKKLGQNFIQVNVLINENGYQTIKEAFRLQFDDPKMFERYYKKLRYYIYKLQSENS